jgi:hypothetical protein
MPNRIPPAILLRLKNKVRTMPKKVGLDIINEPKRLKNNAGNWLRKYTNGILTRTQYVILPILFECSRNRRAVATYPEVYIFAIGGIVGATSVFVGWYYKYGQRRYVNRYLTRIESTYDTLHDQDKQQCILQLRCIRTELLYLFKEGSLSDSHYNILDKKVSDYIEVVMDEEEKPT